MKTTNTIQLALAMIAILFLIISCCPCWKTISHYETDVEDKWHEKTESNVKLDYFIVSFLDGNNLDSAGNAILYGSDLDIVDTCACGKLYLLGIPPSIDPNRLLAKRPTSAGQDGATTFDLGLRLNIIPKKKIKLKILLDQQRYLVNPIQTKSLLPGNNNDVTVAIIDSGIPANEMFSGKIWNNPSEPGVKNGIDDDGNCYIDDFAGYDFLSDTGPIGTSINEHGSYVGQIILNSVDPRINVSFMDLKVFDENGVGNLFDALCALDYAIENDADYINLSWGYYRESTDTLGMSADSLLLHYIKKANEAGIPVFASSGNDTINTDGPEYHYPSGFFSNDPNEVPPNLITVAATTKKQDSLAKYSNYGPQSVLISTQGEHDVFNFKKERDIGIAGTSYSTPAALGYAINLSIKNPGISMEELRNCIVDKSIKMDFPIISQGKINAFDITSCE